MQRVLKPPVMLLPLPPTPGAWNEKSHPMIHRIARSGAGPQPKQNACVESVEQAVSFRP